MVAYHGKTGIAGYTLVINSYGMYLVAHEPFESKETAIRKESDIFSNFIDVELAPKRKNVADTDQGIEIKETSIPDDMAIKAEEYRTGILEALADADDAKCVKTVPESARRKT